MRESVLGFLILFCACCGSMASGQDNHRRSIDSLFHVLNNSSDTALAATYRRLGAKYFYVNNDSAFLFDSLARKTAASGLARSKNDAVKKSYIKTFYRALEANGWHFINYGNSSRAESCFTECLEFGENWENHEAMAAGYAGLGQVASSAGQLEECAEYMRKAISADRKGNDKERLSNDLGMYAYALHDLSEDDKAISTFHEAIEISKTLADQKTTVYHMIGLGEILYRKGSYTDALEVLYEAKEISIKEDNKRGLTRILNIIGAIFFDQENWTESLKNFKEYLALNEELESPFAVANAYSNLASVYAKQENFSKALKHYFQALTIFQDIEINIETGYCLLNIGDTYLDMGLIDSADIFCQRCLQICTITNHQYTLSQAQYLSARIYHARGQFTAAEKAAKESLDLAKKLDYKRRMMQTVELLYQVNKALGDAKEALFYYESYVAVQDSVQNIEIEREAMRREAALEVERVEQLAKFQDAQHQKDKELSEERIARIAKQKALSQWILVAVISIALLAAIILIVWFQKYKAQKRRREKEAERQIKLYLQEIQLLKQTTAPENKTDERVTPSAVSIGFKNALKKPLTAREMEVLIELCKGKENKEIADKLFVSVNTIKTHLLRIYSKMNVKNRTQAVNKVTYSTKKEISEN